MTLALRSPELIHDIISVDNAPVDVALMSSFAQYIQGMKKIEEAEVTKQIDADRILKDYEEVILPPFPSSLSPFLPLPKLFNPSNTHQVPTHPAIPPLKPPSTSFLALQEIPHSPPHPRVRPRKPRRFPFQEPRRSKVRGPGAVREGYAE